MLIRPAMIDDAAAIARVHVQTWQETYRGLMPDSLLDGLSVEERTRAWRERLTAMGERQFVAVAVDDGELIGMAVCGPARQPDLTTDGEIYAINVLEGGKRKRAGTGLVLMLTERLIANGFASVGLWVVEANARARAFYERLGGQPSAAHLRDFGGMAVKEVAYIWPTATDLKANAEGVLNG